MNLKELENILLQHCYNMSILKEDAPSKKKDSILDSLIGSIVRSETSYEDVVECINDVNQNKVIDIDFFNKGGNVENFINTKWLKFAKALWRQRSVGLGTPNAASGEGELMFIFLSPEIKKPTRGDLLIGDEEIELKGESVRVNGKIGGNQFRLKTLEIAKKYKLNPNKTYRTNLDAVEIEKSQHEDYWKNELSKLNIQNQKKFISEYLSIIDGDSHNVEHLFKDNQFNFNCLRKEIVKILYNDMVNDRQFDKFVLLGDGYNAKILSSDYKSFNEKVDNNTIGIASDYFRVNQSANIGWYIY